ncbi:MAG: hypothetical protein U0169_24850 [Polyangiaceae bacterium]
MISVLAIRDGVVPPTVNFEEPDPDCDVDLVIGESWRGPVGTVMSSSFAFGGQNAVLVFRKVP